MFNSELHIVIGPMFSGKTSRLIEKYNEYKSNKNILVVTYSEDNRYSETNIVTHDKKEIPCLKIDLIKNLLTNNLLDKIDVLLLDESQFFKDLLLIDEILKIKNIKIYLFGLDGDFKREKFGKILDLIPLCDTVEKLTSKCMVCNDSKAIFSFRTVKDKKQKLIGSSECYIPTCRICYENLKKKKK